MISKKMITNGFKKEIDINQTLNEFYIKTITKLDISTYFKINYNNTVISDRLNYYLFNDDYEISDEKYYLYKFIEVDKIY